MSQTRTYGPIVEQDVPSIIRLIHHAFAATPDVEEKWIRPTGLENFRGVREPGEYRGSLACIYILTIN